MKKEDLEKYINVLAVDPNSKYILIISKMSGLHPSDIARLKLNDNFLDEALLIEGLPRDAIVSIPITNK